MPARAPATVRSATGKHRCRWRPCLCVESSIVSEFSSISQCAANGTTAPSTCHLVGDEPHQRLHHRPARCLAADGEAPGS